jgi:hypothetical protein
VALVRALGQPHFAIAELRDGVGKAVLDGQRLVVAALDRHLEGAFLLQAGGTSFDLVAVHQLASLLGRDHRLGLRCTVCCGLLQQRLHNGSCLLTLCFHLVLGL